MHVDVSRLWRSWPAIQCGQWRMGQRSLIKIATLVTESNVTHGNSIYMIIHSALWKLYTLWKLVIVWFPVTILNKLYSETVIFSFPPPIYLMYTLTWCLHRLMWTPVIQIGDIKYLDCSFPHIECARCSKQRAFKGPNLFHCAEKCDMRKPVVVWNINIFCIMDCYEAEHLRKQFFAALLRWQIVI